MSEHINGIENELAKGYQSVKKFGSSLVEDTESVSTEVGKNLRKGVSFVGESAEKLYRGITDTQPQQRPEPQVVLRKGPSNLDKVTTRQEPSLQMAPAVPKQASTRMQRSRSSGRKFFKTLINWTILLLILLLAVALCSVAHSKLKQSFQTF
jgi:hypothetical protein